MFTHPLDVHKKRREELPIASRLFLRAPHEYVIEAPQPTRQCSRSGIPDDDWHDPFFEPLGFVHLPVADR